MAHTALKLTAIGKVDTNGNDYYFTRPRLPCLVDLSKVVIFVHPWSEGDDSDDENSKFGAEIVIKEYDGPNRDRDKE